MKPEAQLAELKRGVVDLHVEADLLERLNEGRPLKIKAGFDPTRPDLHLGHTVLLNKMRQFQDLGHDVVFIVGDFTAQIGDPSGRSSTRQVPTREEIEEGARTYAEQAFKILDKERTQIVYNGEWLGKLAFDDVIRLAGKYTLARMMERDDFKRRWAEHVSISLHELLYPLAQAYDSVVLECDVELGGTDQLFNLLVGREIMREMGQRPQIVITTPILEGINARVENGKIVGAKMSKSLDNYVAIDEAPKEQLGKLMSLSDDLMWRYYELLSTEPEAEVQRRKRACAAGDLNPRDVKMMLAKEIVARYHGAREADGAEASWLAQFSQRQVPDDMPEREVVLENEEVWIPKLLSDLGLVKSSSEGRRRIQQGGVEIDGNRISDPQAKLPKGGPYIIKAGKRAWAAVTLK
ncbi:MAG: tyrosine--tRNA ligase [Myxococcales bacterium]|nr:tyrosine--tRNA ligase [Myxococcales bacterium]